MSWHIILKELSCPVATQDLMINTENRDAAIKNPNIKYGPLNLDDDCMPLSTDDDGRLGYCWMHDFKCHSARTCYTWAKGGPITKDVQSKENQMRREKK